MLSITHIQILIIVCFAIIFVYLIHINKNKKEKEKENFTQLCKIYFINLDENIDRWNKLSNKNITRFSAINGKKIDKNKLIKDNIISSKNNLQLGQIGCALSHISVLKLIQTQDEPYGLILEDDVIIPDNFSVNKLKLPNDFDLLFLGGCNIKGKKVAPNLIKPSIISGLYNLCWHAVLVNKNSVQKILGLLTPLRRPIDSQIRDEYSKLNIFYHYPNLINQNKSLRSIRRDIDGLPQSKYWEKNHLNVTIENNNLYI